MKTTTTLENKNPNSCRFCSEGKATHKIIDSVKDEAFFVCDKHLAEYKENKDDIESNIKIREAKQ